MALHHLLPGTALAILAALPGQAPSQTPPFDAHATLQAVAALLEHSHVSHQPLDDTISGRAFDRLLQSMDPLGLYFLQSDVDALAADRDRLDDYLQAGDDRFAMRLQDRYRQRVVESVERALHWLDQPHDFTVDETMSTDVRRSGHAGSTAELDDRWRRRVKYDLLVLEGDGSQGTEAAAKLRRRYERMAERVTLESPEDVDSAFLEAIAGSYDPHTSYFSPRMADDFAIQVRLNYEGIGAVLRDEDGRAVIAELMQGGSAVAAGKLVVGDVIQGVGQGQDGPIEPVHGLELHEVVDKIRGPQGTIVRLSLTSGPSPARTVALERRKTELTKSFATGKVREQDGAQIGWIDLPGFYGDPDGGHSASKDTAAILADFRSKHVDCVVLDLRANGGGLLSEAVTLTGLFLDVGNVVQVRNADGRVQRLDDRDPGMAWNGPLVVLISRFSASASEIVTGAIVDHNRGLVVGDTATHGKGTVQQVIDLSRRPAHRGDHPSGALKLTLQQFFRPDGASTQLQGVRADVVLPSWTEAAGEGEGALPYALPFSRIPAAPGLAADDPAVRRDPALIARLAAAAQQRCAHDPHFQQVLAENTRLVAFRREQTIPLQRSAFTTFRGAARTEPKPDQDDFYVDEVSHIASEYSAAVREPLGSGTAARTGTGR